MCGRNVRSILLLPLVARCLETIDVCIWCMFGSFLISVCMFIVSKALLISSATVIVRAGGHLVEPLCYGVI